MNPPGASTKKAPAWEHLSGRRRVSWPRLTGETVLATTAVAVFLGWLTPQASYAEPPTGLVLPIAAAILPIALTCGAVIAALRLGLLLTVPLDGQPAGNGDPRPSHTTRWFHRTHLRAWRNGLLASVLVLLLARLLSDWHGRHAWECYRAEAAKRGVMLDLMGLMPPRVPDEQNFAATPLLLKFQSGTREWRLCRASTNYLLTSIRPDEVRSPPAPLLMPASAAAALPFKPAPRQPEWFQNQRTDLTGWQAHYHSATNFPQWPEPRSPAEDVLKALSLFDAELAELQAAAVRPHTWFNIEVAEDGSSTQVAHVYLLKSVSEVLFLRAVAKLAAGKTSEAYADVNLMFRLGRALSTDPMLTHYLRVAVHMMALRAVWEGLADHRWTDAQLIRFQAELAQHNLASELHASLASQRAFGNRVIEYFRRNPAADTLRVIANKAETPGALFHLVPSGWLYLEQLNYNRMIDEHFQPSLPSPDGIFDPALIRARGAAFEEELKGGYSPLLANLNHRSFAQLMLPAWRGTLFKTSQAHVFALLAVTACALERHWLAHGSHPESLAVLTPEFLPQAPVDPFSGTPLHYERMTDGRFRLWSVGWDGKDDGGAPGINHNLSEGDWVWPVPQPR